MNAVLRRSRLAAILCATGLAAAACSSSGSASGSAAAPSSPAAATTAAATTDAPTTDAPTTDAPTTDAATPDPTATDTTAAVSAGGGECGTANAAAGTVLTGKPDVKSFEIGAGCDVTITTGLSAVGDPKAISLCDAAAKVAYPVGAKSVTVLGVGDTELAIGIKGHDCIRG